ncbi:MAG: hypothetical protein WCS28_09850 [Thiomicrospira sp.]
MARPLGSLNLSGVEKRLMGDVKAKGGVILAAAIEEAIGGNVQAQKLVLDKLLPNLKPESKPLNFELDEQGSLAVQAGDILKACSRGLISHEAASSLINSLSGIMKIREVEELQDRLAKIEQALESRK